MSVNGKLKPDSKRNYQNLNATQKPEEWKRHHLCSLPCHAGDDWQGALLEDSEANLLWIQMQCQHGLSDRRVRTSEGIRASIFPEQMEGEGRERSCSAAAGNPSNSKCIFWHLPAHTSLPKANKTTVEKETHCLTCTQSQVSGAAWVDRMRSVGGRAKEGLTERYAEAEGDYSPSVISLNDLFSSVKHGAYMSVDVLREINRPSFQDRSHP